MVMQQ